MNIYFISISNRRATREYKQRACNFVKDAKRNLGNVEKILCPCSDCRNLTHHYEKTVVEHLIIKGMDLKYMCNTWYNHGEKINIREKKKLDDIYDLFKAIHFEDEDFVNHTFFDDDKDNEYVRKREDDLLKNLEDAETPLYPGCLDQTK